MRYIAAGLIALLVAAPMVAAGPDALSVAKRALRLAEQPPRVKQVFTNVVAERTGSGDDRIEVRCPRGMIAVGIAPEIPTLRESVSGRRAVAVVEHQERGLMGPGPDGITVTCVEGELTSR